MRRALLRETGGDRVIIATPGCCSDLRYSLKVFAGVLQPSVFRGLVFTLHPELRVPFAQPAKFSVLGLHHTLTTECMLRVGHCIPHPFAQHVLMQVQVARRLRHRHASFLDQPHSLKVELTAELPSRSTCHLRFRCAP